MSDSTARRAERYERMYPGTGVSEAQAAERVERIDFKNERATLRRTSKTRGIVVPNLPWLTDEDDA